MHAVYSGVPNCPFIDGSMDRFIPKSDPKLTHATDLLPLDASFSSAFAPQHDLESWSIVLHVCPLRKCCTARQKPYATSKSDFTCCSSQLSALERKKEKRERMRACVRACSPMQHKQQSSSVPDLFVCARFSVPANSLGRPMLAGDLQQDGETRFYDCVLWLILTVAHRQI